MTTESNGADAELNSESIDENTESKDSPDDMSEATCSLTAPPAAAMHVNGVDTPASPETNKDQTPLEEELGTTISEVSEEPMSPKDKVQNEVKIENPQEEHKELEEPVIITNCEVSKESAEVENVNKVESKETESHDNGMFFFTFFFFNL